MANNKWFWSVVSPFYSLFMRNNRGVYIKAAQEVLPYINSSMQVLELACGTGQFTALLSHRTEKWVATDFSEKMVKQTAKRNNDSNTVCVVEDATNLTFADNSFDMVVIANALHTIPSPENTLKEINRVLKPNGLLYAPTFIYNRSKNNIRLRFLSIIGFKVYNKWTEAQLAELIRQFNFTITHQQTINATPLSEFAVIATKKSNLNN